MCTKKMLIVVGLIVISMACIPSTALAVRGVTDTEIRLGAIVDLTGPAATHGKVLSEAMRIYVSHINDQGGINGRKINLFIEDNAYQPLKTVQAFNFLVAQKKVFSIFNVQGSTPFLSIMPLAKKKELPLGPSLVGTQLAFDPPKKFVFGSVTSERGDALIAMQYATAHSDKKRPKVAIFYQEDEFGKDGLRGIKEGAKFYDYEFVAAEPFKRGSMDFSSQAMNLKKAAPDIVYMSCIFPPAGSLMKETYRLGWKPQFVGCYVSNDPRIADVAGPAAKGLITTNMWARSNEKIPAIQNLRRLVKKYAPQMDNEKTLRDFSIMWSMANTMVMVEGLKKAGRQLTVESFIKGMESLHGYATGLMAPFYYGPNLRRGAAGYGRINKLDLEKKDFVPVTDWFKPKAIK